jgi:hypothetical protein
VPTPLLFVMPGHNTSFLAGDPTVFNTMAVNAYHASGMAVARAHWLLNNPTWPAKSWNPDMGLRVSTLWAQQPSETNAMLGESNQWFGPPIEPHRALTQGYHEWGIELSDLLPYSISKLSPVLRMSGIGFYGRVGPYYNGKFWEDHTARLYFVAPF